MYLRVSFGLCLWTEVLWIEFVWSLIVFLTEVHGLWIDPNFAAFHDGRVSAWKRVFTSRRSLQNSQGCVEPQCLGKDLVHVGHVFEVIVGQVFILPSLHNFHYLIPQPLLNVKVL